MGFGIETISSQPIRFGGYAISLSTAQLVGLLLIALLTFMNTRGLKLGKLVQNVFTTAKTGALIALILLGIIVGLKSGRGRGELQRLLESARRIAGGRARVSTAATGIRPFRRHLRRANELAFLCRRVEQHHLHRRRSE